MAAEPQPSIGRIVRVTLNGVTWPALVIRPPGKRNGIDVTAFTDDGPTVLTGIAQASSRPAERTWHYPPQPPIAHAGGLSAA